jgi:lysophospholipase L1-like esterase
MTALGKRAQAACLIVLVAACSVARAQSPQPAAHDFTRWEKDIAAFEKAAAVSPPPANALLFVGSSTIVRWTTLAQDYPTQPVINRGFGGNEITDSTHFADRIIFPYKPRMIFLRAGGNDIHNGKTAEQVFADFKEFVATVRTKLPTTEIAYISLSPSIARWDERAAATKLNALVRNFAKHAPHVKYIETYDIPLDKKGQPRPELFVEDKLHFSPEGYKLLIARVRPYIPK